MDAVCYFPDGGKTTTKEIISSISQLNRFSFSKICRKPMSISALNCINDDCAIQTSSFESNYLTTDNSLDTFNIRMNLSDFTETLDTCRVYGATAERILGKSLNEFQSLTDLERGNLKWKFLLERCKIKIIIKKKTAVRRTVSITVLDCVVADMHDVLTDIKAY